MVHTASEHLTCVCVCVRVRACCSLSLSLCALLRLPAFLQWTPTRASLTLPSRSEQQIASTQRTTTSQFSRWRHMQKDRQICVRTQPQPHKDTHTCTIVASRCLPFLPCLQVLVEMTGWGIDYTFDATGNTEVMRAALEVSSICAQAELAGARAHTDTDRHTHRHRHGQTHRHGHTHTHRHTHTDTDTDTDTHTHTHTHTPHCVQSSHRGWGKSCVIGVAAAGHEISTRPFQVME